MSKPSVVQRLKALEAITRQLYGDQAAQVDGELHSIRAEIEAVARKMRQPVTMHVCPTCNVGHSSREEGVWASCAARLAPEPQEKGGAE